MKNLKSIILGAFLFAGIMNVQAQDADKKWAVSLGVNMVDLTHQGSGDIGEIIKDYLGTTDWNAIPIFSQATLSRYIDNGLSVELAVSLNKINTSKSEDDVNDLSFTALDLAAKYDLNYLFGETGWFDPYVKLGFGMTWIDGESSLTINPGVGFNTWFNDKLGLTFNSSYKSGAGIGNMFPAVNTNKYFQHSIGVVYKFGGKDSDGDGVSDSKDLCPDVAGVKKLDGCPDSDGDGVVDADDQCPNGAGTVANGGCPDTDGDGVVDKDDACPNGAGTVANGGCPDTDGDGVVDKDDACPNGAGTVANGGCPDGDGDGVVDKDDLCPNSAGPKENKGCAWPDTDGDGVVDKDDLCPNEAGVANRKGCPELTVTAVKELGRFSKSIGFNSGKSTFKPGVDKSLDALAEIMIKYPAADFDINGYTDSTGSAAKNLAISKDRANAVRIYLISKGIDPTRLKAEGFGIKDPIATNKTAAGRKLNRRVEIVAK